MNDDILTFGEAFILVMEGAEIARKNWVDSDTHDVVFVEYTSYGDPKLRLLWNDGKHSAWLPTEEDLFACDWYVLRYQT